MNTKPETLIRRFNEAWKVRDIWLSGLEDAYRYGLPYRNPYTKGSKTDLSHLFDSTAVVAVQRAADKLMDGLTPYGQDWFDLRAGIYVPKDQAEGFNQQLAHLMPVVRAPYQSWGFNVAMREAYLELIVTGLGCLLKRKVPQDKDNPIHFSCVSQANIAIRDGENGEVYGVYHKRSISIDQIKILWPDANLPTDISERMQKEPHAKIMLYEMVERVDDKGNTKWHYHVLYKSSKSSSGASLISKDIHPTNPFTVFRWSKYPGVPYGIGPLMMVMPDVKTANKTKELILRNAALAILGVWTVADDGVINPENLRMDAGAMIPVKRNSGPFGPSIAPLDVGRGFDVAQIVLEDLQTSIKRGLFDTQLPSDIGAVRSPTEIMARQAELDADIGGAYGRLMADLITPLVTDTTIMLADLGLVPKDAFPDLYNIQVQVLAPLARVQHRQDVENTLLFNDAIAGIKNNPASELYINHDIALPDIAEKLGMPALYQQSKEGRAKIQQAVAEQAAMQEGAV